jgi:N-acetyl-1-D-myo-inositol-2-amino-2-deoxy-alpha-D-glucopyranoside deacetylase
VSLSVVAVVAHPDDESLIAGGTLALAAAAGASTGVVCLTRGEQGPIAQGAAATSATLGEVREAELGAAARELGLDWAVCLRQPDGELEWVDHEPAARELAALLATHQAKMVLTFGEDGLYWHPDHIATRAIAARALAVIGEPVELYEAVWPSDLAAQLSAAAAQRGLPVGLWGLEPEAFGCDREATVAIDVRAVLDRKLAAIRAHRTQIGPDHLLASLPADLAERYLGVERWAGPNRTLEALSGRG